MKIKFLPQNIEVEGTPNKSLLQIATENQLEIRSICKGVPSCAECRVKLVEGDNNVLPPNKAELNLIGTNYFIDGRRLSCQVRCFGDVTVDLTEQVEKSESQVKKIRGFRAPGKQQQESHAVNDTMLLAEKIEVHEDRSASQEEKSQQQPQQKNQQHHKQQGKGGQQQQGGGNKQKQKHHHQNRPKNQNQPKAQQQQKQKPQK